MVTLYCTETDSDSIEGATILVLSIIRVITATVFCQINRINMGSLTDVCSSLSLPTLSTLPPRSPPSPQTLSFPCRAFFSPPQSFVRWNFSNFGAFQSYEL